MKDVVEQRQAEISQVKFAVEVLPHSGDARINWDAP
jgi:hypothetical protein